MTRDRAAFAVQWTLATLAGLAIGHLLADLAWFGLSSRWLFPLVPYGGATLGIPAGVLQWLILRRRAANSASWILATAVGVAGSWMLAATLALVVATGGGNMSFFLSKAFAAPVVGLAQRRVLRGWSIRADRWLTVSTAGWLAWLAVVVFAPGALGSVSDLAGAWSTSLAGYQTSSTLGATIVGGACLGAITGGGMAWMLAAPGAVGLLGIRVKPSS
jgi:hypothetical protein